MPSINFFGRKKHPRIPSSRIDTGYVKGLVSVVLPVYNGEKYISKAIESVITQTYSELELIIVNDGSTDNTRKIAESYTADKRVRIINQENRKLPAALNRGFANAKGEFYTWISADNIMLPECIETMAEELADSFDTDMVYGNMCLIDSEGECLINHGWFEIPSGSGNVILPETTAFLNTVANNTIGAAFMYRAGTEAVLGGYSENLYLLEDYDYFMRMNSLFKIRHTNKKEPIYAYRMHPESLTAHDKELGITASRPSLMKFDRVRRKFYNKPLYVNIKGDIPVDLKRAAIFHRRFARITVCSDTCIYNEETQADLCYVIKTLPDGKYYINNGKTEIVLNNAVDAASCLRFMVMCSILRDMESEQLCKNT